MKNGRFHTKEFSNPEPRKTKGFVQPKIHGHSYSLCSYLILKFEIFPINDNGLKVACHPITLAANGW